MSQSAAQMLNYGLRSDTDRGGAGENVAFVGVPLERQLAYTRVWEARTMHMYSIVASDAGPPAGYLQRHLLQNACMLDAPPVDRRSEKA